MNNMQDGVLLLENLARCDLPAKEFASMKLMRGDILLNRTNSIDLVGKVSLFDVDGDYVTTSYIVVLRLDQGVADPSYCNYLLNAGRSQTNIRSMATRAVSQANVNPTSFKTQFLLTLPVMKEQRKVAGFLKSLDELVAAHKQRLNAFRLHKAALMQQLFPSLDELDTTTA